MTTEEQVQDIQEEEEIIIQPHEPVETEPTRPEYTSVEEDLQEMDIVLTNVLEKRRRIINKVETALMTMNLDLDKEQAEDVEAKMQAINSYSKLLADQEKNVHVRVNAKLKQKDLDNKHEFQVGVSDIIKAIHQGESNMPRITLTEEERLKALEMVYDDRGCVVIDEELENDPSTEDISTDDIRNIMNGEDGTEE